MFRYRAHHSVRNNRKCRVMQVCQPLQDNSRAQAQKVASMALALGRKDQYTEAHARRVALYAVTLAQRLGLPGPEVENIRLGGLLHDIGKISLSERIFHNTATELTQDMLNEVRRHPHIGMSILKTLRFPSPLPEYVYYHHERVDGTGYPCGLQGDEIPVGAKIISVADCFDAITTDRPYQKRKDISVALTILRQISGKGLCPEIVTAFCAEIMEQANVENTPKNSDTSLCISLLGIQ